jgi:dynein heavy chain
MRISKSRMNRAEKLVILLEDEGVRWKETVENLGEEITNLVGDVFLSCACISYFGGFTGVYREEMTAQWTVWAQEKAIPCTEPFNLVKIMGDPMIIKNWNMNYLPSDRVSLENGILTTKAERWGLCIDPQ